MDEELGVKAPVTRLRRRLSTEAEGTQSPSTPSTPNKKRATRLAKPALELIDENVPESKPKKVTRRASTLDTTTDAPADEKPATPSRRSTRIRSNTSLLLEVTQSIVADSPRAKRALRRNSQAGSDTESVTTPARRTRARKDSTSSIEKLAVTSSSEKVTTQVVEAISEEPEKDISKDKLNITQDTTPLRKSPRLSKKGKKNEKAQKDDNELPDQNIDEVETSLNGLPTTDKTTSNTHDKSNRKSKDFKNQNLSLNSAKLINDLPTTPKIPNELNKSVSSIEQLKNEKNIRKRTKSWTTLTNNDMTPQNIDNTIKFASGDSVIEKLNVKSPAKIINKSLASTENEENISSQKSVDERNNNSNDTIKMLEITPTKNIKSVVIIEDNDSNSENAKLEDQHNYDESVKNDKGDQCVPVINTSKRLTSESFSIEPMDIDETIPDNVTINFSRESISGKNESVLKQDSDQLNHFSSGLNKSSNKSSRKSSISLQQESNASPRKFSSSVSEESKFKGFPVDKSLESETSHNKSLITMLNDDNDSLVTEKTSKSGRKSSLSKSISDNSIKKSLSSQGEEEQINDISNKSKRKSVSVTETSSTEKTSDENKSTLVLSHLKDVSRNEITNVSPNNINNDSPKLINIANKEKDKINQSNYSTSTPLQQKSLQKLAMQINTSSISPHVEIKNTSKANKSKTPVKNKSNDDSSHDSNSSEESDEDSSKQSKIIDNEAKEASDDYESGDSRDSEDVQYEKDHEITEKGETLESEPYSDESDYEKDSFVVTSDEEDGDLLSGSGDDLSLSDNELKMTAKSKTKFDERKRKEQKKASREMYEARHQLEKSDKPGKSQLTKKGKKLDSSASESEEEKTKPKKKNRLRIDSSQDITMNNSETNANITCNKKKTKRLSESVCENNVNEKEITIHNQSLVERSDPLAATIKKEPKTPQRDFNMATVLINDNIEQVLVNTEMSMIKSKETSDPLQITMQEDEESDSDISENMQIKENYDSVLQSLNKSNKQNKVISHDASLNLNKKTKNTVKPPIVDELNLTQTKYKKSKAQNTNEDIKHKASGKKDDGENSDSIDMRLLFPEDSNDSEKNSSKFKPENNEEPEEFIPLKKTEAKTNLRENMLEPEENTNVNFFIDTRGNFDMDISTEISANKKNKHKANTTSTDKKNRISDVSHAGQEPILSLLEVSSKYEHSQSAAHESSTNVSMGSSKKKRKKNKSLLDDSQTAEISETTEETPSNISQNNDKKKNMSQLHVSQHDDEAAHESTTNVSMGSNKKKRKKNKSLLDDSQTAVMNSETTEETPSNISQNNDKKKNMSQLHVSQHDDEVAEEVLLNVSVKSEKKKKKNKSQLDTSQIVEDAAPPEIVNDSLNSGKKKKNKSHLDISQIVANTVPQETEVNVSLNSEKKKKRKNKSQLEMSENLEDAVPEETITNVSQNSDKKKKNKPSNNIPEKDDNTAFAEKNNISHKKEKKNKSLDVSQNIDNTGEESDDAPMEITYKSEKTSENPVPVEDNGALNKSKNKFKKKKKKTKKVQHETDDTNIDEVKGMKRKHNEDSSNLALDNIQMANTHNKKKKFDESGNVIPGVSGSDKPNKRKADDDIQRNAKVFKDNIFKKIHIPRLPETVINQLVDQPASESKKPKKKKEFAISTVPFVVEEGPRRKNKPSNYLEQSIYLNDYKSPVKQKKKFANPKVLPFTPTVITSGEGYTSKFKINVLPQNTDFIAQTSSVANFRESRLAKQREKKIKVEQFKKQRKHMLAKF